MSGNGLVNQVKFLALAQPFATMNLTTICSQPAQKGYEQILLL